MKALDTFRKTPYCHNCAQAIANRWQHLYGEDDIVLKFAPFLGGKAPKGYCGALYAAMEAMPEYRQQIIDRFVTVCGSPYCREIKLANHVPCEKCVQTADDILESLA